MTCRETEPLLLRESDGGLTSGQHAALAEHLAVCPACREMRDRLNDALATYRRAVATAPLPDVDAEWRILRGRLSGTATASAPKRPLAPVLWFGSSLAAAAALTLAYLNFPPAASAPVAAPLATATPTVAQADFVEAGDANASTLVYVDKASGWLVVWATDAAPAKTSG